MLWWLSRTPCNSLPMHRYRSWMMNAPHWCQRRIREVRSHPGSLNSHIQIFKTSSLTGRSWWTSSNKISRCSSTLSRDCLQANTRWVGSRWVCHRKIKWCSMLCILAKTSMVSSFPIVLSLIGLTLSGFELARWPYENNWRDLKFQTLSILITKSVFVRDFNYNWTGKAIFNQKSSIKIDFLRQFLSLI